MITVDVTTNAEHPKDYENLKRLWKPYLLQEFNVGEYVPANPEYLTSYVDDQKIPKERKFAFKTHVPRPRGLRRLDNLLATTLKLEFNNEENIETKKLYEIEAFIDRVKEELFESELESSWWDTHREIVVTKEPNGNVIIEINNKDQN